MGKTKFVRGLGFAWILSALYVIISAYKEIPTLRATGLGAVSGGLNTFRIFVAVFFVIGGLFWLVMHSRVR